MRTEEAILLGFSWAQADKKPTDDPATWRRVFADSSEIPGVEHNPGQYFPKMAAEMLEFQARIFRDGSEPGK